MTRRWVQVTAILAALATGCSGSGGDAEGHAGTAPAPAPASGADEARHRSLLAELAERIVPAADGGWVVASVDDLDPGAPDRWTLAAVAGDLPAAREALAAALDVVRSTGDDLDLSRRAAQAVALALADPAAPPAPVGAVDDLAERAAREVSAGDGGWLGVLLNLALTEGPASELARDHLETIAGPPSCDRLPGIDDPLPGPDGALTLPLRLLAASGLRCRGAAQLLERGLADPAWTAPIAAAPLADLVTIADDVSPVVLDRVAGRLAGWIDPEGPAVVDLAVLVLLRRSAAAIGRPLDLPEHVALRLRNVAARHGALPDRSSSPPTALDVAIVRQLHGVGLVSDDVAASTRGAVDRNAAPLPEVVDRLFIEGAGPGCGDELPPTGRVGRSIGTALGEAVVDVGRLHCGGDLSWATISDLIADGRPDEAPVRAWAAVLAACALDPSVLGPTATLDLELQGPFRDDPVWLVGAAMAAAPRAACDAEGGR